ncbi:MAG: GNAT family N-acetyltransferase [Actinomycetota bacterium]
MQIRRAARDDLRRLCVTAMRSFHDDPVIRWVIPDDAEYFSDNGEIFRGAVTGWLDHDEVWCTDDCVAMAAWIPPGRPEPTSDADPPLAPLPDEQRRRFEILGGIIAEHTPAEPHWYLQLLGTHPDWQRQGLGHALMTKMFERTDPEGLPCWLETETEDNVVYYRSRGFEVASEWDVPDGGPHMWGMWRTPR